MECFGITIMSVTPTQGPLMLSVGMSVRIDSLPTGTVHLKYFPGEECFWPKDHRFVHFSLRLRLTIPLPYTLGRMGVHLAPCSSLLDESVVVLQNVEKLKRCGSVFEERIGKHSVVFRLRSAKPWRHSVCRASISSLHRPSFLPPIENHRFSFSSDSLDEAQKDARKDDQEQSSTTEEQQSSTPLSPQAPLSPGSSAFHRSLYALRGSPKRLFTAAASRTSKGYRQASRVNVLKDLNSDTSMGWCPSQSSDFSLRVGPNYMKHGTKSPSPPALYDCVFCDVVRCPQHIAHCVNRMVPPPKTFLGEATQCHGIPPYVVINLAIPLAGPLDWFSQDETSTSIVVIGRLSDAARKLPEDDPGLSLWKQYLEAGNEERAEGSSNSLLLKFIVKGENLEELTIPGWALPHIKRYNAKPVLMQRETLIRCEDDWAEISTNCAKVNPVSRTLITRLKGEFKKSRINIGCAIQGVDDDELPERLLIALRFQNLDLEGAGALAT